MKIERIELIRRGWMIESFQGATVEIVKKGAKRVVWDKATKEVISGENFLKEGLEVPIGER